MLLIEKMRKVYIQKVGNRLFSENCFSAAMGFAQMGYQVIEAEVGPQLFTVLCEEPESMFVGGINGVKNVFRAIAVEPPQIDNPHIYLPQYLGREVVETTWTEVEQMAAAENFPFFIKPLDEQKLFTGYVVKCAPDLIQAKLRVKGDTKILMSECVEFISEWRCFVLEGKLVGCKNYTGDFRMLPNFEIIDQAIVDYKNQPIAYSIDFGITSEGKTLLIEMNDAYGLSSYGLNKMIYCKILEKRWDQIIKNNSLKISD
jgi:hypothetical protein